VLGVVSIATLCLGLSACLPPKSMWSDTDALKRNTVTLHHITHDLKFAGGTTGLTDAQTAEVNHFLSDSLVGYGDEFSIEAASDEVAASRREALTSYLRARGLVVSGSPAVYGAMS
jgi:hypothetical protein